MAAVRVKMESQTQKEVAIDPKVTAWLDANADTLWSKHVPIREVLQNDMEKIYCEFGGPQQFLFAALSQTEFQTDFAAWLDQLHCDNAAVMWDRKGSLPVGAQHPFQVRISDLSFLDKSPIKPPAF